MSMTKSEEKRAAILANQEARELAEREVRQASGGGVVNPRTRTVKPRKNWAASAPLAGRGRGRPPKAHE